MAIEATKSFSVDTGDGSQLVIRSWPQAIKWIDDVSGGWRWIKDTRGPDPADIRQIYARRIAVARDEMERSFSERRPLAEVSAIFRNHLIDGYTPPHPKSERGLELLRVREIAGDEAALFALGMRQGLLNFGHIQTNDHWRGASLALNPELLAIASPAARLKAERAQFIKAAQDLSEMVEAREADRADLWRKAFDEAGESAGVWGRTLTRRWLRVVLRSRRRERRAIEKLHATDVAFSEKMALRAPVEYWEKKAAKHKKAENEMQGWLWLYFPIAFLALVGMFGGVGRYLLNTPQASLPPGLTIVASAGLATAAGMLFWVGRLLTKLYLSQHHLRHDAEERATMTTTYLALTEVSAPGDADRQIVLNALFRNTPDGIVKDEGGLDPSLASALGRFLAR